MTFTIPGPLHSYHETRSSSGWAGKGRRRTHFRTDAYHESQRTIRLLANVARIPDRILDTQYAALTVAIYWSGRARMDASNAVKWIEDALFVEDRRILELHVTMCEHAGEERADVRVDILGTSRPRASLAP